MLNSSAWGCNCPIAHSLDTQLYLVDDGRREVMRDGHDKQKQDQDGQEHQRLSPAEAKHLYSVFCFFLVV